MKTWLLALAVAVGATMSAVPDVSEAKRLGSGRSAGMQRSTPAQPPANTPPSTQPGTPAATPNPAAAPAAGMAPAAAAAAGKRSWLGPIAGLAAGLGIAALFSHLGLGEGLANFVMLLLLAAVAFFAVRFLLRRFAGGPVRAPGLQPAAAAAGAAPGGAPWSTERSAEPAEPMRRDAFQPAASTLSAAGTPLPAAGTQMSAAGTPLRPLAVPAEPEGFDRAGFERIAKMLFVRLQAANDSGQVDDLRKFTTPELFASLRVDLQERAGQPQQTDVEQLDATLVETAQEDDQWIASVRFRGLIREEAGQPATPFDEVWHFVRPIDGSREWAIAGITQTA